VVPSVLVERAVAPVVAVPPLLSAVRRGAYLRPGCRPAVALAGPVPPRRWWAVALAGTVLADTGKLRRRHPGAMPSRQPGAAPSSSTEPCNRIPPRRAAYLA